MHARSTFLLLHHPSSLCISLQNASLLSFLWLFSMPPENNCGELFLFAFSTQKHYSFMHFHCDQTGPKLYHITASVNQPSLYYWHYLYSSGLNQSSSQDRSWNDFKIRLKTSLRWRQLALTKFIRAKASNAFTRQRLSHWNENQVSQLCISAQHTSTSRSYPVLWVRALGVSRSATKKAVINLQWGL